MNPAELAAQKLMQTIMSGGIANSPEEVQRLAFGQALMAVAAVDALMTALVLKNVIGRAEINRLLEAEYTKTLEKLLTPKVILPAGGQLNGG